MFGVDWNGPLPVEDSERDTVEVSSIYCPLCDADKAELQRTISPVGPRCCGVNIFIIKIFVRFETTRWYTG